jgi:hypothetical protein
MRRLGLKLNDARTSFLKQDLGELATVIPWEANELLDAESASHLRDTPPRLAEWSLARAHEPILGGRADI